MNANQVDKLKDLKEVQRVLEIELSEKLFDYELVKNSSIDELEFLGEIEIDGKIEPVYHYVENTSKTDDNLIGMYYTKSCGVIARDFGNSVVIEEEFLEKEPNSILEQLLLIRNNDGVSLEDLQNEYMGEMAENLGIDKSEIRRISTIDLDEEYDIDEIEEKDEEKLEDEEDKVNTYSIKDVNIKQEININEMANDVKTIGQVMSREDSKLAKQLKGTTKLGIIESSQMRTLEDENGKKHRDATSRYSIVAIKPDGQVIPLYLKQDNSMGSNPMKDAYYQEADGDVRKEKPEAVFSIGKTNLMIENGNLGEIEIYYGEKDPTSNEKIGMQLRTDEVINKTRTEYRGAVQKEYDRDGTNAVKNAIDEAELHHNDEYDSGKVKIADTDGEEETKTHEHDESHEREDVEKYEVEIEEDYIPDTDITWDELADETGESIDVLKERFESERTKNPTYSSDIIVQEIREDYERINDHGRMR